MCQDKSHKLEQWNEFFEELQQETERGAVLLGAAFLDEHLRLLITAFMISDEPDVVASLLKPDAPLGTFSARITTAYCLGLISQEERQDLDWIRKIRNKFAHELHGVTFEDPQIVDWCNNLIHPKKLLLDLNNSKTKFLWAVVQLSTWLALHRLDVERNCRRKRKNTSVKSTPLA